MKKILGVTLVVLLMLAAYLLAWPVPIEPQPWTPAPAPKLEGAYAKNELLKKAELIAAGLGRGPEGVALDAQGRVYAGFDDGRVYRFAADGTQPVQLANTGGRPLGTLARPDGSVVVADAEKGLLRIAGDGAVTVLSSTADGVPFRFTDDVDAGTQSPVLYFTDASSRFGIHATMADVLEHAPNGRVLAYDPASGTTQVVVRDLYFPNGIAVGPDDAFFLVNETTTYRILRHWLKGEKAGQTEVFADNLPGFPDNISFNGRDRFWCAIYSPRVADLDRFLPLPFVRKIVFRLPAAAQPRPAHFGMALGFNVDGQVVANLQGTGEGAYAPVTSVEEHDGWLYFGSLSAPSLARLRLGDALR
ncbi:MAG TPA: SMP-30/gluconolactonase/LRE family protein [Candidatus Binatia bacterium]|nr:SMP-30/gluconolactonase/LRE family protein [Candidatus Binatia bacterium]